MEHHETAAWFRIFRRCATAPLRLFCFPYAGAGPSIFREWPAAFADAVELVAVNYPGREARASEPLLSNLGELIEALRVPILAELDRPFAFFGHSMGALICFELARVLTQRHGISPEQLFVSAAAAPHRPESNPIHALPTIDFLRAVMRLDGMPVEVLQDPQLLKYVLPILRADFSACERYRFEPGVSINCPLTVFGGALDPRVERSRLEAWRDHASVAFALHIFQGGHFFLRSERRSLLDAIRRDLAGIAGAMPLNPPLQERA